MVRSSQVGFESERYMFSGEAENANMHTTYTAVVLTTLVYYARVDTNRAARSAPASRKRARTPNASQAARSGASNA